MARLLAETMSKESIFSDLNNLDTVTNRCRKSMKQVLDFQKRGFQYLVEICLIDRKTEVERMV